jgi:hypothetical protein
LDADKGNGGFTLLSPFDARSKFLLGTPIAEMDSAHPQPRKPMNPQVAEPTEKLTHMAERANLLVHEAHDVLERMDTTLTLAEAKLALTQHLISKRHHEQQA